MIDRPDSEADLLGFKSWLRQQLRDLSRASLLGASVPRVQWSPQTYLPSCSDVCVKGANYSKSFDQCGRLQGVIYTLANVCLFFHHLLRNNYVVGTGPGSHQASNLQVSANLEEVTAG